MSLPSPDEVLLAAAEAVRADGKAVLCQIVRAEGSTPGKVGWKLVVSPGGRAVGNLGGGAFEALVAADARLKLAQPGSSPEVKRYYLTEEAVRGEPTGMVCGGFAEVLIEVVTRRPLLVICGGGPVGQAIAHSGHLCGFELRVVEDREEFRDPRLFPKGTSFVEVARDFAADFLESSHPPVYVVVVTRCWETDLAALVSLLRRRAEAQRELAYVGLMGSRRKVERVCSELAGLGHDLEDLELHAPVGLPIGAETPAEIAVSILAEIIRSQKGAAVEAELTPDPEVFEEA